MTATENMRKALKGIYHDAENSCVVASDGGVLMAVPETGITESWIEDNQGNKIDGEYPKWRLVVPDTGCTSERENYKGEIEILRAPVSTNYIPVEYDIDIIRGAARLQKFIRDLVLVQGHNRVFYAPELLLLVMEAFYATGSTNIELFESESPGFLYLRDGDKKGIVCQFGLLGRTDAVIVDLYANDLM
jgi:hypothetical protein